jgi:alpha-amylase
MIELTTVASQIPLSSASYPEWSATVGLAPSTYFEFKFIRHEKDGSIKWEGGSNRNFTTPASGSSSIKAVWKV